MKNENVYQKQFDLYKKIQEGLKLDIVTCPICGAVNITPEEKDVICYDCDFVGSYSDFPDLFY